MYQSDKCEMQAYVRWIREIPLGYRWMSVGGRKGNLLVLNQYDVITSGHFNLVRPGKDLGALRQVTKF